MIHIPFKRRLLFEKTDDKEDLFLSLMEDLEIKIDQEKYPNYIFYFFGEENIFQHNLKNGNFYCSYKSYWSIFEKKHNLNYFETQLFTKKMMEEYCHQTNLTPLFKETFTGIGMEEHYNQKGLAPAWGEVFNTDMMEKHFKQNVLTPVAGNPVSLIAMEKHFRTKE